MLHAENGFDQAGDASRFERMADVGFDAGDGNPLARRHFGAEHFAERLQLGGIAQLGGRGMAFQVLQARHVDARAVGPLHRFDLPFAGGAHRLLPRPSVATPKPRTTAWIGSPSAKARSRVFIATAT